LLLLQLRRGRTREEEGGGAGKEIKQKDEEVEEEKGRKWTEERGRGHSVMALWVRAFGRGRRRY